MLEFRELRLSDKPWVDELLAISDFRGCDYCFANNLAWRRLNDTKITRYKDFYISASGSGEDFYFTFPAGGGDYADVLSEMKEYAAANGLPFRVASVSDEMIPLFTEIYGDGIQISTDPGNYDYVYNAADLMELKGKKYHQKRNHLNNFYKNEWEFHPLTERYFDECIEFAVNSYNESNGYDSKSSVSEQFAINTFFSYFNELGLKGGVLFVSGKLVGFTIGERINSDTLGVHIEKAYHHVQGAYAAVNNEFAKLCGRDFAYINREEDLGIEGLRKSKLSYYPAFQIKRNTIEIL